jgi:hypothetical protein
MVLDIIPIRSLLMRSYSLHIRIASQLHLQLILMRVLLKIRVLKALCVVQIRTDVDLISMRL